MGKVPCLLLRVNRERLLTDSRPCPRRAEDHHGKKLNAALAAPPHEPEAVRLHLRVTGANFRYVTGIYLREQLNLKCQEFWPSIQTVSKDRSSLEGDGR